VLLSLVGRAHEGQLAGRVHALLATRQRRAEAAPEPQTAGNSAGNEKQKKKIAA
jgi:hypothetical protein